MADKEVTHDEALKDAEEHAVEVQEKGYDEDALTDMQKDALKHEEDFREAAEDFQEDDDNMAEKRQQV